MTASTTLRNSPVTDDQALRSLMMQMEGTRRLLG